ncbi:Superfamily II RNA helicase [Mycoavidus cysteinexigens]|uniref:Superfamily II RNA helicase n=1 Tax=Mycoavidus cysteinexigens TaxID=1553431 RepID=A0A2Z6EUI5_9BURK|nr:Superfamily II RNA helicase [Mycoavidus cysteinexigens]GAM52200.1 hypothetical protein EBME_0663 [bacterium endosymbiont of Mortierella elongata FMR23-6]
MINVSDNSDIAKRAGHIDILEGEKPERAGMYRRIACLKAVYFSTE